MDIPIITEFEVWDCRFRSDKPASDRTAFFFDYDVVFIQSGSRYRLQLTIEESVRYGTTRDFRFSDGTIVRAGTIQTIPCRQSVPSRLLEAPPTHDTWGYHLIWLSDYASIDNFGNVWSYNDPQLQRHYSGVQLSLNLPYLEWIETVSRTAYGKLLGEPKRFFTADYRKEFPDEDEDTNVA